MFWSKHTQSTFWRGSDDGKDDGKEGRKEGNGRTETNIQFMHIHDAVLLVYEKNCTDRFSNAVFSTFYFDSGFYSDGYRFSRTHAITYLLMVLHASLTAQNFYRCALSDS